MLLFNQLSNFRKLEDKFLKLSTRPLLKRTANILLLDLFILVFFMLIPAGIVKGLEQCFSYAGRFLLHFSIAADRENSIEISDSIWYTFQTVTTIGFGDIIAGTEGTDYCIDNGSDYDLSHQRNAIFWVNKQP